MKTNKKRNRPGKVLKTVITSKGRWEIYSSKKDGKTQYGNRLISRNGNLICSNFGFNQLGAAIKNMRAVQRTAV